MCSYGRWSREEPRADRWAGCPHGVRADAIPFTARVFAVVDALEAMSHARPYRPARPLSEALETVRKDAGARYDPRVVEAALAISPERWIELLGSPATS